MGMLMICFWPMWIPTETEKRIFDQFLIGNVAVSVV